MHVLKKVFTMQDKSVLFTKNKYVLAYAKCKGVFKTSILVGI